MWLVATEIHVANSTIFFDNYRKLKKNNDKTMFSDHSLQTKKCSSYAEFSPISCFACLTFRNFGKLADSQPVKLRHFVKETSGCQQSQTKYLIYAESNVALDFCSFKNVIHTNLVPKQTNYDTNIAIASRILLLLSATQKDDVIVI